MLGAAGAFGVGQTTHSTGPFPSDAPDGALAAQTVPPGLASHSYLLRLAPASFVCWPAGLVNLVSGGLVGGRARARCLGGGLMGGLGCWLVVGGLVGSGLVGRSVGG